MRLHVLFLENLSPIFLLCLVLLPSDERLDETFKELVKWIDASDPKVSLQKIHFCLDLKVVENLLIFYLHFKIESISIQRLLLSHIYQLRAIQGRFTEPDNWEEFCLKVKQINYLKRGKTRVTKS